MRADLPCPVFSGTPEQTWGHTLASSQAGIVLLSLGSPDVEELGVGRRVPGGDLTCGLRGQRRANVFLGIAQFVEWDLERFTIFQLGQFPLVHSVHFYQRDEALIARLHKIVIRRLRAAIPR